MRWVAVKSRSGRSAPDNRARNPSFEASAPMKDRTDHSSLIAVVSGVTKCSQLRAVAGSSSLRVAKKDSRGDSVLGGLVSPRTTFGGGGGAGLGGLVSAGTAFAAWWA